MLGLRAASSKLTFNLVKNAIPKPAIRFNSSTNFNDPESRKPTLEIDSFAKSKRLNRPISPHLFIYQPQLTWVLSGLNRATGGAIAACKFELIQCFILLPCLMRYYQLIPVLWWLMFILIQVVYCFWQRLRSDFQYFFIQLMELGTW
jgi:hypothetical protein